MKKFKTIHILVIIIGLLVPLCAYQYDRINELKKDLEISFLKSMGR